MPLYSPLDLRIRHFLYIQTKSAPCLKIWLPRSQVMTTHRGANAHFRLHFIYWPLTDFFLHPGIALLLLIHMPIANLILRLPLLVMAELFDGILLIQLHPHLVKVLLKHLDVGALVYFLKIYLRCLDHVLLDLSLFIAWDIVVRTFASLGVNRMIECPDPRLQTALKWCLLNYWCKILRILRLLLLYPQLGRIGALQAQSLRTIGFEMLALSWRPSLWFPRSKRSVFQFEMIALLLNQPWWFLDLHYYLLLCVSNWLLFVDNGLTHCRTLNRYWLRRFHKAVFVFALMRVRMLRFLQIWRRIETLKLLLTNNFVCLKATTRHFALEYLSRTALLINRIRIALRHGHFGLLALLLRLLHRCHRPRVILDIIYYILD